MCGRDYQGKLASERIGLCSGLPDGRRRLDLALYLIMVIATGGGAVGKLGGTSR